MAEFKVIWKRYGHEMNILIDRTQDGWHVIHATIAGDCDKGGNPYLYKNFNHDAIAYPAVLEIYMKCLWERAERGLSDEELQQQLNQLAEWVSLCERGKPKGLLD